MAKAAKTISDLIWLRDALKVAAAALGSDKFAKAQIRQWLASGALPWDCLLWQALDADGIAKMQRHLDAIGVMHTIFAPSGPYRKGDAAFFACEATLIDFENNSAREGNPTTVADGASAEGIKVSAEHLHALLAPIQLIDPKVWFAQACENNKRRQGERKMVYAGRLHKLMQDAPVKAVWSFNTLSRRLRN
jgi:hypothetical protein